MLKFTKTIKSEAVHRSSLLVRCFVMRRSGVRGKEVVGKDVVTGIGARFYIFSSLLVRPVPNRTLLR